MGIVPFTFEPSWLSGEEGKVQQLKLLEEASEAVAEARLIDAGASDATALADELADVMSAAVNVAFHYGVTPDGLAAAVGRNREHQRARGRI